MGHPCALMICLPTHSQKARMYGAPELPASSRNEERVPKLGRDGYLRKLNSLDITDFRFPSYLPLKMGVSVEEQPASNQGLVGPRRTAGRLAWLLSPGEVCPNHGKDSFELRDCRER